MKKTIIVSRHQPTIEFLKRKYPDGEVKDHLDGNDLERFYNVDLLEGSLYHFIGNLPLDVIERLLKSGHKFTLVSIKVERGERGGDIILTPENVKLFEVKSLELEEIG